MILLSVQVQMPVMGTLHSLVWLPAAMAQTRKAFSEPGRRFAAS